MTSAPICLLALLVLLPVKAKADSPDPTQVLAMLTGGYDTEGQDRGRPVILVASALAVPPDVFRSVFKGVHPAPPGEQPDPEQVRRNKQVLMDGLSPYGVTDDRLNEVSNFYRYRREREKLWRHTPATVVALVQNGAVVGFKIADAGAGYSSPPVVSVPGFADLKSKVVLAFGTDFKTNGSIASVTVDKGDAK